MTAVLYPLYTIAQIALLVWGGRLWPRSRSRALALLLLVITALLFDNLVIAMGRRLGEGGLLESLNWLRFLFHVLLTPLLIVTAVDQTRRAGVRWANQRVALIVAWVMAAALIILGFLSDLAGMVLSPVEHGGTLRYAEIGGGPPIPSIITIMAIIIVGLFVWRKLRWPWMFAGAMVMFIGAAVPPSVVGPAVGSGAEIALLAGLLATEKRLL